MPRFLLALTIFLGACSFDGRYPEGVPCGEDMRCPSGMSCHLGACVSMVPIDIAPDQMPPDVAMAALTCADPGIVSAAGGTASGTTAGTTSKMSSTCGGFVNNGPDRVYAITMTGTNQLRVAIDGDRKAYVLSAGSCVPAPSTPACLGSTRATTGNPIVVQPPAGLAYVVVDDEVATASGPYTLTLTVL